MMHLHYDEVLKDSLSDFKPSTSIQFAQAGSPPEGAATGGPAISILFEGGAERGFREKGWRQPGLEWAKRQDRDIFVDILHGLSGVRSVKIVASRPNRGAVKGLSDRTVLEYSQVIENRNFTPARGTTRCRHLFETSHTPWRCIKRSWAMPWRRRSEASGGGVVKLPRAAVYAGSEIALQRFGEDQS